MSMISYFPANDPESNISFHICAIPGIMKLLGKRNV